MAYYFKEYRARILDFMAAGQRDIRIRLLKASFVKTSNGYWLAWDKDSVKEIAVLPPDHPREFPCEWLYDAGSIEQAVALVEAGLYVRTTDYNSVVQRVIVEDLPNTRPATVRKNPRKPSTVPYLTDNQQTKLIAGNSMDSVLTDKQQQYLKWRKKVPGELLPETQAPSFYLHALQQDGSLTFQFKVKTIAPQWYVHIYVHPNKVHFHKHLKSRSNETVFGCLICRVKTYHTEGLMADIHLCAEDLSELTVIHEAVHAGAYLSRILDIKDAKTIAAPYIQDTSNLLRCREEIQCRTVEFLSKQIVMILHTLNIPCTDLRSASM